MNNTIFGGAGIVVSGSNPSMPYISMSNPSAGMVRYNGNISSMEVYDGASWLRFGSSGSTQITLDPSIQTVIEWARKKMVEEAKIKELADKYPAVKDLKEKLDIVVALVQDYQEGTV